MSRITRLFGRVRCVLGLSLRDDLSLNEPLGIAYKDLGESGVFHLVIGESVGLERTVTTQIVSNLHPSLS